jgi:hypothetical protein
MDENDTMQEHISKLDDTIRQLGGIGVNYPDDEVAMTLLDSLPESYSTLVVILESMSEVTSEFVKTRILQEEARRKESTTNENTAFFGKKSEQNAKKKGRKWSTKTCTHCTRLGHKHENCWILHPEK